MRGEETVGEGDALLGAWNDWLYQCWPDAPVDAAELASMWVKYDAWRETQNSVINEQP